MSNGLFSLTYLSKDMVGNGHVFLSKSLGVSKMRKPRLCGWLQRSPLGFGRAQLGWDPLALSQDGLWLGEARWSIAINSTKLQARIPLGVSHVLVAYRRVIPACMVLISCSFFWEKGCCACRQLFHKIFVPMEKNVLKKTNLAVTQVLTEDFVVAAKDFTKECCKHNYWLFELG